MNQPTLGEETRQTCNWQEQMSACVLRSDAPRVALCNKPIEPLFHGGLCSKGKLWYNALASPYNQGKCLDKRLGTQSFTAAFKMYIYYRIAEENMNHQRERDVIQLQSELRELRGVRFILAPFACPRCQLISPSTFLDATALPCKERLLIMRRMRLSHTCYASSACQFQ